MLKQENLSALIRSLTPNESRYFRLYSSIQPGEKKYIELFEELESNVSHTTQSLCAKLNLKQAQLATIKHYLYHQLLRSLRNYEEHASQHTALNNSMEEAKVFSGRRMYSQALDVIESTLKKAWDLEAFELTDDLLQMKYICIHNLYHPEKMEEIVEKHKETTVIRDELMEMMRLSTLALTFETQRNRADDFKKILDHPLMKKKPGQLKSLRAHIEWFGIMFRYYFLDAGNPQPCLDVVKKEAAYYQKNQQIIGINPLAYLVSFTRVGNIEYRLKNYAEALDVSNRFAMELRKPAIEITKARRESMNTYNRLFRVHVLVQLHRFAEAADDLEDMTEVMKTRNEYEQYTACYLHAITLLHLKQSDKANRKIDELLQIKTDVRKDIQPYARVLLIMVQIDLGNFDLVPHLVVSARMWMKRNKLVNKEITLFFTHIMAISKTPLSRRTAWLKLKQDIDAGKFEDTQTEVLIGEWVKRVMG